MPIRANKQSFTPFYLPWLAFALLFTSTALALPNQSLENAISKTKRDLTETTSELNALRDSLQEKRLANTQALGVLENEVAELRETAERHRKAKSQTKSQTQALKNKVSLLKQELSSVHSILSEYRRSSETRMHIAESRFLEPKLLRADKHLSDNREPLSAAKLLLELAADWNTKKLKGAVFPGICLDDAGITRNGRFVVFGPMAYFFEENNGTSGISLTTSGSTLPSLFKGSRLSNQELLNHKETKLPLDVTNGTALRLRSKEPTFSEHIRAGGLIMIPLLLLGLGAISLFVWKFIEIQNTVIDTTAVESIVTKLNQGAPEDASNQALTLGCPLRAIVVEGIEHFEAPREQLEEVMSERLIASVPALERHLDTLAVIAAVSPLLGLLGTVTGMIHTFELVTAFGSADAKLLSGGISEALVTTEFGLLIAIPTLLVHAYLSRRVRLSINDLEGATLLFLNRLHPALKEHVA